MSETIQVRVPNIGDFDEVEVIEVLVSQGDAVQAEQSLITVESDKASMEIPSPSPGVVKKLLLDLGDKVSEGSAILELEVEAAAGAPAEAGTTAEAGTPAEAGTQAGKGPAQEDAPAREPAPAAGRAQAPDDSQRSKDAEAADADPGATRPGATPTATELPAQRPGSPTEGFDYDRAHVVKPHASPSVRKFARELGVDLSLVRGSGPKQRIVHDDVREWVKAALQRGGEAPAAATGDAGAGLGLIPWPKVDFARFGPIESKPIARIRRISAANLHRNWVMIPHVTNHEDADITELEAFRVQLNREQEKEKDGVKLTMLAFLIKACVVALKQFPEFNASLDGENLILKRYYHIGFAADTPNGLVVPVIRDADGKGVLEIARETAVLAAKAREGKLSPGDMQGGTFSISSLGGIGGTYFTPIINAPEVAILGVCRSAMRPTWQGKGFEPRLILPLSLSWDHRVIDGASAARFNTRLAQLLADFRRALL